MDINLPGLVTIYRSFRNDNKPLVLATIVETEGPVYRKPGARMLIDGEGSCYGLLGVGLEESITEQALQVFRDRKFTTWVYDSRSGKDWEAGQDNNCMLRILFEYVSPHDDTSTMALLEKALEHGARTVLATITESDLEEPCVGDTVWIADGECRNPFPEQHIQEILDTSLEVATSGRSSLESFITETGSFNAFFEVIRPRFHLLIAGAGADAAPLLNLAKFSGWLVTMADPRKEYLDQTQFQQADRRLCVAPEELLQQVNGPDIDAAILMTHKFDYDLRYFTVLAGTPIPYIGLLGPAAKREKLLEAAKVTDVNLKDRVYGPVGLDIGAELPEEVAFSIIGEIMAVSSARSAGFLSRSREQSVPHQAIPDRLYALVMAAGGSRRFGGLKQLVELQGKSLLRRTVEMAMNVVDSRVFVVLGMKAKKLEREIKDYGIQIVENLNWENGIASSIRTGIDALPQDCDGALILFCDQPFVTAAHIKGLINTWSRDQERIISSRYGDSFGVPVIFPRKYFTEMMKLTGDNGAKSMLQKYIAHTVSIDLPEAALDIDTQEDLIEAIKKVSG